MNILNQSFHQTNTVTMKKFFVISNLILFLVLVIMIYLGYFNPIAFLVSFACFILAVLNSGMTERKILIAAYILEAVASIFLFLANGPFAFDWFMDGISLPQIALVWLGQTILLMLVLGVVIRKRAGIEKLFAPKA